MREQDKQSELQKPFEVPRCNNRILILLSKGRHLGALLRSS